MAGDVQRAHQQPRPGGGVVHPDEKDGVPDRPGRARQEVLPGILYRDEKSITEILNELSGKYDNVYIKGNLSEVMP